MKRAVLYLRVSTTDQTTANQERELRQVAKIEQRIRDALKAPGRTEGVRKIAARFGVNASTVQRINRDPFDIAA